MTGPCAPPRQLQHRAQRGEDCARDERSASFEQQVIYWLKIIVADVLIILCVYNFGAALGWWYLDLPWYLQLGWVEVGTHKRFPS